MIKINAIFCEIVKKYVDNYVDNRKIMFITRFFIFLNL